MFPNYEGTRADFHAFLIDVIRPIDGNKNIYPAYNFVFIESLEPKDMTLSETQRSNFIRATMCLELQIMPIHRNRSSCRNALKAEGLWRHPSETLHNCLTWHRSSALAEDYGVRIWRNQKCSAGLGIRGRVNKSEGPRLRESSSGADCRLLTLLTAAWRI